MFIALLYDQIEVYLTRNLLFSYMAAVDVWDNQYLRCPPTTIRIRVHGVLRPILHAYSNYGVHLTITSLVVKL